MEQLTQMEFLQLRDLLSTEALVIKKYQLYARDAGDDNLRSLFSEAARTHQENLDALVAQLRSLNGKSAPEQH
jgi:hypothetical protein